MSSQIAFRSQELAVVRPGDEGSDPRPRRAVRPRVAVVMPAHNEAGGIASVITEVVSTLVDLDLDWEILVVDDGSTDGTTAVVAQMDPSCHVALLRLSRNFGKEAAISAGLDHANGDVVLCMDSDGQHPTSLIKVMLERWREGYDMIYAVRNDRHREGLFKRFGSRAFYRLMKQASDIEIPPDAGDFRWMDRCVVDAVRRLPEHNRFMKGLYSWVGFRSIGVSYAPLARSHGRSSYSRLRLMGLAWNGITSFSVLPLRAASIFGAILAGLAFAYGLYELLQSVIFGTDVPGWPTVVVGMMFFSGVQLLFIGILGEYLARVYDEVKGRPTYVVAEWRKAQEELAGRRKSGRDHL